MNAAVPRVLVVASDRPLLRHVANFLELFGYHVTQAADAPLAMQTIEAKSPEVVLVDADSLGEGGLELCRALRNREEEAEAESVHLLLLKTEPSAEDLVQALEAGCDDFLAKPIVYGELLARLRSAAHLQEASRQERLQYGSDPVTNLPLSGTFVQRLGQCLAAAQAEKRSLSCVVMGLDCLAGVNRQHGWPAGNAALALVAEQLPSAFGTADMIARLGDDRFAVLLSGTTGAKAAAWSERFRANLEQLEIPWRDVTLRLTASFGVAAAGAETGTAEQLLDEAGAALRAAKVSGRNCVMLSGELAEEMQAWLREATPSRLFESTLARDVMTPCGLILREDEPLAEAAAMLSQCRLGAAPVVNQEGLLSGLLTVACLPENVGARGSELVRALIKPDVVTFDETARFETLFEFFVDDPRSEIVIVEKDRPRGLVTRQSLAALIELPTAEADDRQETAAERVEEAAEPPREMAQTAG